MSDTPAAPTTPRYRASIPFTDTCGYVTHADCFDAQREQGVPGCSVHGGNRSARATPPALDVERLAEAMRRIGYIVYEGDPDDDNMCPNCVTPWKCNGPHILKERPDANDKEAAKVAAEYARLSPHNREAGE